MFKFEKVFYRQEDFEILKDISWEMKYGEKWAVLGLNGSGKTTLLKMLNGYLWPSSGNLEVLHHVFGATSIPELRRKIGWISYDLQRQFREHEYAEHIVLSGKFASIGVWENVTDLDREQAKDILIGCGGYELIGKRFAILSQGERQIVLIARAMMANPELLILDEPCNGLDLFARERLLKRVDSLAIDNQALGLIFVTHYIEEIPRSFDKVLLLREGEVFAQGNRDELFTEEVLTEFYQAPIKIEYLKDGRIIVLPE